MAAAVLAGSNSKALSESELLIEYSKLITIRDESVAKSVPDIKQVNQSANLANSRSTTGPPLITGVPALQRPNGISQPAATASVALPNPSNLHISKTRSLGLASKSPNVQKLATPTPGSSGIDPIFLTKSAVLVRAEIFQKRQRLEKALEEQVLRSQRQRAIDQDALPDFDVTEVLRKAQELVKPRKLLDNNRPNGAASSSDSFDENTFYSSQMDDSTTSEDTDESQKRRPPRICKFFLRGVRCRYGEMCSFSHDPTLKQKPEAESSQAVDHEPVNADKQASSVQEPAPNRHIRRSKLEPEHSTKEGHAQTSTFQFPAERERQNRIARLEAELRSARAEQDAPVPIPSHQLEKEINESQEESAYSPPGPDEYGRDISLRETGLRQAPPAFQRRPSPGQPSIRKNARQDGNPPSPPNNVRVITSHIRSPIAPQPSRVSPLAVAKVPQVSQVQRDHGENHRLSRASNTGNLSAGQSPKVVSQPRSSRKRRRGRDSGEQLRNVIPRTDSGGSPAIRVKQEPVSPPPFEVDNTIRPIRPRQEAPRRLYADAGGPQHLDEHPVLYQSRLVDRPSYGQLTEDRGPQTPLVRRVVSRNGLHYIANEETDLRRVVTAPRQVRAPMSPDPYPIQHSAPQARATRAASQIYLSPTGQAAPHQLRASVQPQSSTYITHDRIPSPLVRRIPRSPPERHTIAMAPPPRRVVVDQWGNRFMEAPMPIERHASVAPVARESEFDPRYEQVVPRGGSVVRQPHLVRVDDEGQYVRRAPSPTSNGFFEVPTRKVIDSSGNAYEEGPYLLRGNGSSAADRSDTGPVPHYFDGVAEHDARIIRMPSVRPVGDTYEAPRGQLMRVQSLRPEQPRIIKLGERQEGRQVSHPVSGVPDGGDFAPIRYAVEEGPRYQYASPVPNRGYVEEVQDESGMYDAPGGGGRRLTQRIM